MSEKKVVSRKVAIALGIVCIVLLILLAGNVYTLSSRISSLSSQVESLKSEISTKNDAIADLELEIKSLEKELNSPILHIITENYTKITKTIFVNGLYYDRNNDVESIAFRVDDGPWQAIAFSNGLWNFTIDPFSLTDGFHTIEIKVTDRNKLTDQKCILVEVQIPMITRMVPEVMNYPDLEKAYTRLHAEYWYYNWTKASNFLRIMLEGYKSDEKLQSYSPDILMYAVSYFSKNSFYDENFFTTTIVPLAKSLRGSNDLETAMNVRDFVRQYIRNRGHVENPGDIKMIYELQKGMCEELSNLMVALLRGAHIPARYVASKNLNHAWVEIFYNYSWIPIDSTGLLDTEFDLFKERITEDAFSIDYCIYQYVGWKYSVWGATRMLDLKKYDEWAEKTEETITEYKKAKSWEVRERLGKLAFEYSIMSIFGFNKTVQILHGYLNIKNNSTLILFTSSEALKYNEGETPDFPLTNVLKSNVNVTLIIILSDQTGPALIFSHSELAELGRLVYERLLTIKKLRDNFTLLLLNITTGVINEANFTLPRIENTFLHGYGAIYPGGYAYTPCITSKVTFKELKISVETAYLEVYELVHIYGFTHIKFIDLNGKEMAETTSDGYLKQCPWDIRIPFPQEIRIYRENNWIIIKANFS